MRKTLTTTKSGGRNGMRILAAVALTGSLAAFGCTTNRTPGYGEPAMSNPAAGSVTPNSTSTPGSANTMGTMPQGPGPQAMISSSPANGESASLDALATLKADEAFRGKVLGPAAPGDNTVPSASMQQVTGQFISPSAYANPQSTVNSSISSAPTPAVVSGAAGDTGGVAVITGGTAITAGATIAPTTSALATGGLTSGAAINGVQNVGTTGVSSATATPITNGSTANAATTPASNTVATPILTTVGPLGQVNAATGATVTGGSVLGVTNVAPANVSATPTVTATTVAPATAGVSVGMVANSGRLNTSVATPVTANVTVAPTAARARAVRSTTAGANAGLRVVTTQNGQVVVTNQPQTALQRFLTAVGLRHNVTAAATTNPQK